MDANIYQQEAKRTLIDVLEEIYWKLLAEEGITPALVDFVDLDVTFSPVLAIRGEQLGQEVEVYPSVVKGKWIVRHSMVTSAVDEQELKVMRLRFLLRTKEQQGHRWGHIFKSEASRNREP